MSSSKFKFVCLHTHAHTHGVKNSFAREFKNPIVITPVSMPNRKAMKTQNFHSASVTPGKSISLAPIALVHGKTRGLCLCCAEGKADVLAVLRKSSAFLPRDVEPVS